MKDSEEKPKGIGDGTAFLVSSEEQYIIEKFSRLVGKTLSYVEAALPVESQCKALKKLVEGAIYDTRNEIIALFHKKEE